METFLALAFIVWFFCGLIAWAIAADKGNDGCFGFILGFLLGPLGIVAVAASPTNPTFVEAQQKATLARQVWTGELKKCPYCAETIKREAKVCRYCGRDLPPPLAPSLPNQAPSPVITASTLPKKSWLAQNGEALGILVIVGLGIVLCFLMVVVAIIGYLLVQTGKFPLR